MEEMSEDSIHNKPVDVRECGGSTYAVAIEQQFKDGSSHVDHYTEAQAQKIFSDLQEIGFPKESDDNS